MENTSLAGAAAAAFPASVPHLRKLWSRSPTNPGIFFCARQAHPGDDQVWKIGVYSAVLGPEPDLFKHLGDLSVAEGTLCMGNGSRFSYAQMIHVMEDSFYREATNDPLKGRPDHFGSELRRFKLMQVGRLLAEHSTALEHGISLTKP